MDPDDTNNESKSSNNDQDRREAQRRLRLVRLAEQDQYRGSRQFRRAFGRNSGEGNAEARPEEAPSSMGNRRNRAEAGGEPLVPAAAAAAAAVPPNPDANDDDEEGGGNNPKLRELLQHLREFCRDGDRKSPQNSAINHEKARNVLEACAGNVQLAGQLYWDDYFASQQQQQQQPPLDAPSAAAAAAEQPAAAAEPEDEERRVRRRLESDFERLLPAPPPENYNPPPEAVAAAAAAARPPRRRRRRRRAGPEIGPEGGDQIQGIAAIRNNVEEDVPMADADPPGRPAAPAQRRPQDNQALLVAARAVLGAGEDAGEGSVSVSDDEAGVAGVLRMVRESGRVRMRGRRRNRASGFDDEGYIRARNALSGQVEAVEDQERTDASRPKKRKACGSDGGDGGDDSSDDNDSVSDKDVFDLEDDDAYLSDNDWLFTAPTRAAAAAPANPATSQPTENLRAPLSVLWNATPAEKKTMVDDSSKDKMDEDKGGQEDKPVKQVKSEPAKSVPDGESNDDDDTNEPPVPGASKRPEIPSTWLHASFSPHSTAMGLALKDPKPEDVQEHTWRLQQISNEGSTNRRNNNSVPLPYHCRGLTAILSIVTAAMYTGASVQSNQVTCSSSRVPFMELSEELRKREFESRLVDALSALIFIAAKASRNRKQKALTKRLARKKRKRKRQNRNKDGSDEDTEVADTKEKNLVGKLKLCPVSWWKETTQNSPVLPAEQWENSLDSDAAHTGPRIQVSITFSNIMDIRAFVLSNMQSFTGPGGVALLLETIVGIHGEGAVKRMLQKSNHSKDQPCYLVSCDCEARQKKRLQDSSLSPAERRKMTNSLDTTPPGHECVSQELISLLLTGKIHSSLKGWTAGPLGFGCLTHKPGEVGRPLSRPELPVWVVRGETFYSVLLLDHTTHGDNLDERVDSPTSTVSGKGKGKEKKKSLIPSKPKATACMKISMCSSTSRSRDLQEAREFARKDQPGYIANMAHWNPWYGTKNLSRLRLITARPKWTPPESSWVLASYKSAPDAKPVESLACSRKSVQEQLKERRQFQSNVVSSCEEDEETPQQVDEAAMDRMRFHPDDAKFYPKQHRLWRFDMGERDDVKADPDSKPRGVHWVPYHSLSRDEQRIVETKFGPQINRILWTRWPGSEITIWPGRRVDNRSRQ